jgi:hypothetical protein
MKDEFISAQNVCSVDTDGATGALPVVVLKKETILGIERQIDLAGNFPKDFFVGIFNGEDEVIGVHHCMTFYGYTDQTPRILKVSWDNDCLDRNIMIIPIICKNYR